MKQTFSASLLESIYTKLENPHSLFRIPQSRQPVHVVYGGAHLFKSDTPQKLGNLALKSLETYAPNTEEFANVFGLKNEISQIIYKRVKAKLQKEAVEDFRIDFEDGYGFRAWEEEDSHAISASDALARSFREKTITPFCGFRIKSFAPETFKRSTRTLDLFLTNLIEKTAGELPENFVVTLPKITRAEEVEVLTELLEEFETQNNLPTDSIKIEIMIETPEAILNQKGEIILRKLVEAACGRCKSAHFGAFDYTSAFGIVAEHQHLQHEACNFARQMMQIALSPLGIRLSDSVTTEMPVPIYKGENLSGKQTAENRKAIHKAWRAHFDNITHSLINGFYQSWDLHPAQFVARYAAIYAFFFESKDSSAKRLEGFIEKAAQANLTGNQFDDAASAQGLLNFFIRAQSCGALDETEILEATNLSSEELRANSFAKILADRDNI